MPTILISAGDLSGERHAAALVRAVKKKRLDAKFLGLGGNEMRAAGVDVRVGQEALAIGGIFEAVGGLRQVVRAARDLLRVAREEKPDLIVLVDSGGFHLPLARRLRKVTKAPILYFIPPQVWAWRQGRLARVAEVADRIAVILPFEREVYEEYGVPVDFVGHPVLDQAPAPCPDAGEWKARQRAARLRLWREEEGMGDAAEIIGLFPGSRRSELGRHLPIQVESFRQLRRRRPDLQAVLVAAPNLDRPRIEAWLERHAVDLLGAVRIETGGSDDLIAALDVGLAKPGTITLELMLAGCPMVVMGKIHPLTAGIVRRSLQAPFWAMPNLLGGKEIVPEYLQDEAIPTAIVSALEGLLQEPGHSSQRSELAAMRERLGAPGACERTAQIVEELLEYSAS